MWRCGNFVVWVNGGAYVKSRDARPSSHVVLVRPRRPRRAPHHRRLVALLGGMIRGYDPADRQHLRLCVVELQDFERQIDPALPAGEQMADAYLEFLFERCARWCGQIFVAEIDRAIVGFVGVLTRVPPEVPDESPAEYAYISDLVVLPSYRRRGIGRALLE